jgi:hypothetical protein
LYAPICFLDLVKKRKIRYADDVIFKPLFYIFYTFNKGLLKEVKTKEKDPTNNTSKDGKGLPKPFFKDSFFFIIFNNFILKTVPTSHSQ